MKTDLVKLNDRKLYNKKFFREFDVLHHINPNDFWVILNRRVLDLSHLVKLIDVLPSNSADLTALHQLCMFGGTDISKLFGERQKNQLEMFALKSYTEYGNLNGCFWWNDPVLIVGSITSQERHICVRNKSKGTQYHLAVCEEDSIYTIRAKFCAFYSESSYENMVWRKHESTCCPVGYLFLDRTLTENGLAWSPTDEITYLWIFRSDEFRACNQMIQTVRCSGN